MSRLSEDNTLLCLMRGMLQGSFNWGDQDLELELRNTFWLQHSEFQSALQGPLSTSVFVGAVHLNPRFLSNVLKIIHSSLEKGESVRVMRYQPNA